MGNRLWLGPPCTCALVAPRAASTFSLAKTRAGVVGPLVGGDGDVHFHSLGEKTHQPQWL